MQLVEVDDIDLEPAQAFFATPFEGSGATVCEDAVRSGLFHASFGCEERARGALGEGVTDEDFVPAWTVGVSGVDEACAEFGRFSEEGYPVLPCGIGAEVSGLIAEPHGTVADPGNGGDSFEGKCGRRHLEGAVWDKNEGRLSLERRPVDQCLSNPRGAGAGECECWLLSVFADGLDRATFHRFATEVGFLVVLGLFEDERMTVVIVALEVRRSGLAAEVTIDALVVHVETALHVLFVSV